MKKEFASPEFQEIKKETIRLRQPKEAKTVTEEKTEVSENWFQKNKMLIVGVLAVVVLFFVLRKKAK